jgi:hypothetical protein
MKDNQINVLVVAYASSCSPNSLATGNYTPVPSESVFQHQRARLEQAAMTFLREEERHCIREGMPREESRHALWLDLWHPVSRYPVTYRRGPVSLV